MTPKQKKAVEKILNHIETAQEELHKAQRDPCFAGEPNLAEDSMPHVMNWNKSDRTSNWNWWIELVCGLDIHLSG
jgi:hypothetical protein